MTTRMRNLFAMAMLASALLSATALAQQYDRNDPLGFDDELRGYQEKSPYDAPDYLNDFGRPGSSPYEYYRVAPPKPRTYSSNPSDFFSSLTPQQQVRFAQWASDGEGQVSMAYMAALMDLLEAQFDQMRLSPAQRSQVLQNLATEAGIN
jgi:hypothetical protein